MVIIIIMTNVQPVFAVVNNTFRIYADLIFVYGLKIECSLIRNLKFLYL